MRMCRALLLVVAFALTLSFSSPGAANDQSGASPPVVTKEERQRLHDDAMALSSGFRELFRDLSSVGGKLLHSAADFTADWVESNYERLSEEKRQFLQQFLKKLQKESAEIKELSLQAVRRFLSEFQTLLQQLDLPDNGGNQEKRGSEEKEIRL